MIENLDIFHSSAWGLLLQVIGAAASIVGLILSIVVALISLELLPLTWRAAVRAAKSLIKTITADNWKPDLVVCLGRSGGIWGGLIAGNLGSKPAFMVMDVYSGNGSYVEFKYIQQLVDAMKEDRPKRVLVVQGYSGTGGTFFNFREAINKRKVAEDVEFRYASVFAWRNCRFTEHHYVGKVLRRPPKRMPWHMSESYVTAM